MMREDDAEKFLDKLEAAVPDELRADVGLKPEGPCQLLLRGFDRRSRCVHQRSTQQSRSRFPSENDSDHIGYTFTCMTSFPPTPNGPHQLIAYPKHQGGLSSQVLTPL
jgi:hypothetical protein